MTPDESVAFAWAAERAEALLLAAVERFGPEPLALLAAGSALHQGAHKLYMSTVGVEPSPELREARERYRRSLSAPRRRRKGAGKPRRRRRRSAGRAKPAFDPRTDGAVVEPDEVKVEP